MKKAYVLIRDGEILLHEVYATKELAKQALVDMIDWVSFAEEEETSPSKLYDMLMKDEYQFWQCYFEYGIEEINIQETFIATISSANGLKAGDRVRFRTWEDMQAEYDGDDYGIDLLNESFMKSMKHLCGTYATVAFIIPRWDNNNQIILKDFTTDGEIDFNYCPEMLEKVEE